MEQELNKEQIKEINKKEAKGCLRIAGIYVGSAIIIIVILKFLLGFIMK